MDMTLKKVAEAAGVSHTTVSLVLNNVEGSRVSQKTRGRVLEAIRKYEKTRVLSRITHLFG
jgi:DNA-binding LacI/PurR family transcriptional regulator